MDLSDMDHGSGRAYILQPVDFFANVDENETKNLSILTNLVTSCLISGSRHSGWSDGRV